MMEPQLKNACFDNSFGEANQKQVLSVLRCLKLDLHYLVMLTLSLGSIQSKNSSLTY